MAPYPVALGELDEERYGKGQLGLEDVEIRLLRGRILLLRITTTLRGCGGRISITRIRCSSVYFCQTGASRVGIAGIS